MRADLALVGFGHVARRFASLTLERRDRLAAGHDLDLRIVSIATRQHGTVVDPRGLDVPSLLARVADGKPLNDASGNGGATTAIGALAESDAPLRILVETTTLSIADGQPAIAHVEQALAAGCDVVTANKGPAAFAYRRLRDAAAAAGRSFLFEGAVMDGIPIFNLVRETLPAIEIKAFRGVVNSTTNSILTALESGEPFGPALARMQAEGIAERDASLDLDGWDAAAKTAALANVLFDAGITPHDVLRTGIGEATADAARAAHAQGRRLRLVAAASRTTTGAVHAVVQPVVLAAEDPLAGLTGTANALLFETDLLGEVGIFQYGGGITMTAYALVSDIITVRRRADRA